MVGEGGFRDGLRDYLKRYTFANATWLDLVAFSMRGRRGPGGLEPRLGRGARAAGVRDAAVDAGESGSC